MNRFRIFSIALAATLLAVSILIPESPADEKVPSRTVQTAKVPAQETIPPPEYLGMQSCSASACHGNLHPNTGAEEMPFDEVHVWMNDPHGRAYQTLFNERSRKMFLNLGVQDAEGNITNPALFQTYWQQCLGCHDPSLHGRDPSQAGNPLVRGEGVSCEGCHGPASQWVARHYRAGWKDLSSEEKSKFGFRVTSSMQERGFACASCHVGDEDRNVNHDLIAAGHPAMKFELTWYERRLPPHWNPQRRLDKESPMEKWLAGQLSGADQVLRQLQRRAETAEREGHLPEFNGWPELAEYSCFACHHELVGQRGGSGPRTTFPYGPWDLILIPELARSFPSPESDAFLKSYDELARAMSSSLGVSPEKITSLAKDAVNKLAAWKKVLHPQSSDIAEVVHKLSSLPESTWERDAQLFLALAAPYRKSGQLPPAELIRLRNLIALPSVGDRQFDSPRNYLGSYEQNAPESYEEQSQLLRDLIEKLTGDFKDQAASGK